MLTNQVKSLTTTMHVIIMLITLLLFDSLNAFRIICYQQHNSPTLRLEFAHVYKL